jgi:pyrimidine-nucleoside phosphorylase
LPSFSEADFADVVSAAREGSAGPQDVAGLASHLANSGERLVWPGNTRVTDVASTGGPGSLSTLLTPFALVAAGCRVVKLGVPGRPAGAIDVLGTLPGYQTHLSADDVRAVLAQASFAHFLADERFAPLDAALFAYRRKAGAVAVPVLAAASLLAKKLAVGVTHVGLDVRVGPHGNFGTSRESARANATLFCAAAKCAGISAIAFLTDAERVPQPWIGRGESLVALAHALGIEPAAHSSPWAAAHVSDCYRMAAYTAGIDVTSFVTAESTRHLARQALDSHLESQGSSTNVLRARVSAVLTSPRRTIRADRRGVFTLDLDRLRSVMVAAQEQGGDAFSDPVGLELLERPRTLVEEGQPLARVRPTGSGIDIASIESSFIVVSAESGAPPSSESEELEIVRG